MSTAARARTPTTTACGNRTAPGLSTPTSATRAPLETARGAYSHIGIYLGNNMAADNSDYGTNMRYGPVVDGGRGWTAWHVFDNGLVYPSNGWYEFDGALYHYSNCQYDVDTVVDGITIGSDGIALAADGSQLVPGAEGSPALSSEYVSATTVADALRSLGYETAGTTSPRTASLTAWSPATACACAANPPPPPIPWPPCTATPR